MQNNEQNGFTIIEVAFYVCILLILTYTLFSAFIWGVNAGKRIASMRGNISALRHISDVFYEDISTAASIYTPTTNASQISLYTNANAPSGESASYIDFYVCGSNLCRKRDGQTAENLLPDDLEVSNFSFTIVSTSTTPSIKVNLGIRTKQNGGTKLDEDSISTSFTVSMRSY